MLGIEGYRQLVAGMKAGGIALPTVAIGGICLADIPEILSTGVNGIAMSGSILRAADPVAEMRKIAALVFGM